MTKTDPSVATGRPLRPAPGRVRLEITVPTQADPQTAYAAITDWPAQGQWMIGTEVHVASGDGTRVGDELAAWTGVGRIGFWDTMTITDISGGMVVVEHTGRVVRGIGWMGVTPRGAGANFVWGEDLELPFGALGRAGWIIVGPLMKLGVRASLRAMAAALPPAGSPRRDAGAA